MTIRLNPHIGFTGNAAEGMEFYQSVFGGDLQLMRFIDLFPDIEDEEKQKVMHAVLTTENGLVLMGADSPKGMPFTARAGAPIALTGDDEPALRRYWDALRDGGAVTAELEKAPWGDYFGMCVDKYGVEWMIDIGPAAS